MTKANPAYHKRDLYSDGAKWSATDIRYAGKFLCMMEA